MTTTKKINVTRDDIIRGVCKNSRKCMIARAIRREVPGARGVDIYPSLPENGEAFFHIGGTTFSGGLPKKASANAIKFDQIPKGTRRAKRAKIVKPFSFILSYTEG